MLSALLVVQTFAGAIPPAEMAAIASERLSRLDHLVVELTVKCFGIHSDAPSFDPADWDQPGGFSSVHPYRLTIVRPNVLAEYLRDEPEAGFVPNVTSVFDGMTTGYNIRPYKGKRFYGVVPLPVANTPVTWDPVLQVFDIDMIDSSIPQLNVVRLLEEHSAVCVRSAGGIYTYSVSIRPDDYHEERFDFDLNGRGTPLRVRSVFDYDQAEAAYDIYEQFVLATTEVNGAEFPLETVAFHYSNPRMPNYYNVFVYSVTDVRSEPDLTPESVRIDIDRRNAVVTEALPDGREVQTWYDENGTVEKTEEWYGVTWTMEEMERIQALPTLSGAALPWRMFIPPVAGAVGVATALGLWFVSRRGRC